MKVNENIPRDEALLSELWLRFKQGDGEAFDQIFALRYRELFNYATRFTKDHEWVSLDGDIATVGISKHAADALGDVVFVEVPEVGKTVSKGDSFAVVESVKAASDILAPVDGEIVAVNQKLVDQPGLVNEDPTGAAWFFKMKLDDLGVLDDFMDEDEYNDLIG